MLKIKVVFDRVVARLDLGIYLLHSRIRDAVNFVDSQIFSIGKGISDTSSVSDQADLSLASPKADVCGASDNELKSVGLYKSEIVPITDTGFGLMQDYCDLTYFADNYVGIKFNF